MSRLSTGVFYIFYFSASFAFAAPPEITCKPDLCQPNLNIWFESLLKSLFQLVILILLLGGVVYFLLGFGRNDEGEQNKGISKWAISLSAIVSFVVSGSYRFDILSPLFNPKTDMPMVGYSIRKLGMLVTAFIVAGGVVATVKWFDHMGILRKASFESDLEKLRIHKEQIPKREEAKTRKMERDADNDPPLSMG